MCARIATAILFCCLVALASPQPPQGAEKPGFAKSPGDTSQTAASRHPQNEIERAKQMLQTGSTNQAIALLREVLRKKPDNADAHLLLGTALALVPERSEALKELQKAVDLQPKSAMAYFALGTAQARFAEFEAARKMFEKAIQLDPIFADAHVSLAMILAQQKELALAREYLVRAIQMQGNTPSAAHTHYLLAQILMEQNEPGKALQELHTATSLRPDYAEAYLAEGLIRKNQHNDVEAIQAFKKAVALSPQDFDAQYQLGATYLRSGEASQAIAPLQKASELNPADRPARYQLCRAFQGAGRTGEAKGCEQKLSTMIQTGLTITANALAATESNNEGVDLEKIGNFAAALEKYRAAVTLDPSQTVFKRNLALALCRLGRWEEGVAALKEVLKEDPDDAKATKALYIALENVRSGKAYGTASGKAPTEPK